MLWYTRVVFLELDNSCGDVLLVFILRDVDKVGHWLLINESNNDKPFQRMLRPLEVWKDYYYSGLVLDKGFYRCNYQYSLNLSLPEQIPASTLG